MKIQLYNAVFIKKGLIFDRLYKSNSQIHNCLAKKNK